MKFNEAWLILNNIESDEYTVEEKGLAILRVAQMETHNSITKAAMLRVIRFLLPLAYEIPESEVAEK